MTTLDISLRKRVSHLVFPRFSPFLERMNWSARWIETVRSSPNCLKFATREEMFSHLQAKEFEGGQKAMDFFEFGVFEGQSLTYWCGLNSNPQSRFIGFDSFQGLPEQWNRNPTGTYSAHGKLPAINDARVEIVVGWFQNSLPGFLASYRPQNPLLIHNDSDLYTSTLFTLTSLNPLITPGTIIIFDEFYDPIHEYRALVEYTAAYTRKFELLAATPNYTQAAVRIL